MRNVQDASAWDEATLAIAKLGNEPGLPEEFVARALATLAAVFDCDRATHITCTANPDRDVWIATGASFPALRSLRPIDASELRIFNEQFLLSVTPDVRVFLGRLDRGQECFVGCVVQLQSDGTDVVDTLSLTLRCEPVDATDTSWHVSASACLRTLTRLARSRVYAHEDSLQRQRRIAIDFVLQQYGDVESVASAVCDAWRRLTGAEAVRLWVVNTAFDELNLLYGCCTPQLRLPFATTANRLPLRSLGGRAIATRAVQRVTRPADDSSWVPDHGLSEMMRVLPSLVCVPLISPDTRPDAPREPRLRGVIDLHLRDSQLVDQPDDRLLFFGSICAAAVLRARSLERLSLTDRLNRIALGLVNPSVRATLKQRKQSYLNSVSKAIQEAIHARSVSVFEADESRDIIRCIYSSRVRKERDLVQAVYRAGGGLTWDVFSSGRLALTRQADWQPGEHREKGSLRPNHDFDPLLAVPLPGEREASATGVIRVRERECHADRRRLQTFTDFDRDLMLVVAQHVSPTLQLIRIQAHREVFIERTSHQVIQPLQGVIAYASNACDGIYDGEPDKLKKKLRYIRHMAKAAAGMMRSSMWASSLEVIQNLGRLARTRCRVQDFFVERVIDLQPIREADDIKVEFVDLEGAEADMEFLVDDVFFDQAVQNVLHNAVKYSYPQTRIEVSAAREGTTLIVLVTSHGVPIDAEERERIFGDRERGRSASAYDPQGTGQGLFIARQIMRGFGGDVSLEECVLWQSGKAPVGQRPAHRTTFKISYPEAVCQ